MMMMLKTHAHGPLLPFYNRFDIVQHTFPPNEKKEKINMMLSSHCSRLMTMAAPLRRRMLANSHGGGVTLTPVGTGIATNSMTLTMTYPNKHMQMQMQTQSIHSTVWTRQQMDEEEEEAPQELGTVAAREIAYEKADVSCPSYEQLQEEMNKFFKDWETDVCREQAYFRLHKTLNDEIITVEVNACNPESVDRGSTEHENFESPEQQRDYEADTTMDVVSMTITIEKTGQPYKIYCIAGVSMDTEPEMEIVGVQMIPKDMSTSEILQTRRYEGPEFSELDVSLQRAFHDYLLDRGFDEGFAEAVRDISDTKEEVEYISWLENVRQFSGGPEVPSLGERE